MQNLKRIAEIKRLTKGMDKEKAKKAALMGMEKGRRMAVELANLDKKRSG